ncbi:DUF2977 domain-containing protein [Pediococcus sp. AC40]|jgi:hypothetical protein|uniref:DUF2977 domain-containing protein n=1 Tax=Pediococcus sp. AC40 TaxID=2962679 RepID=UPI00254DD9D4|nr:DUF2977 domain-containing protein [Pediococcus sp. AC40]
MLSLKVDQNIIVDYAIGSGLIGDNVIQYDGKIPDDFYENYKPFFYLLKNNEIVENPDYVEPKPPVIGPSEQDKINAQIMINQAKQKEEQDEFNAQTLLQLAKLGGNK